MNNLPILPNSRLKKSNFEKRTNLRWKSFVIIDNKRRIYAVRFKQNGQKFQQKYFLMRSDTYIDNSNME